MNKIKESVPESVPRAQSWVLRPAAPGGRVSCYAMRGSCKQGRRKTAPVNGAVFLWNEDKMKKMKLSLAIIILPAICYTKNTSNVT